MVSNSQCDLGFKFRNSRACEDVPIPNGEPVEIPHRDPRLPRFYRVPSHAKVAAGWRVNRIFVYLQDTSPAAMQEYYKFVSEMTFPEGTDAGIAAAGMISACS